MDRPALEAACGERLGGARFDGLWVAGSLDGLHAPAVAIVGTRAPSDDGRRRARVIAEGLAHAGVCIVSGLALGIDGAAHAGALAASAPTIGVLGGGHAHFFPQRHRELGARMIAAGGAVVSPFAPDVEPRPWQFLARNAVIAALVDVVVVVEAATRSGALNTASHAADAGVPVLALPGDIDHAKSAGCNALIRDGATLVRGVEDVLAALPLPLAPPPRRAAQTVRIDDPPDVRRLLAAIAGGARDTDTLLARLALPPHEVLGLLGELEIAGRLVHGAQGYALI